MQTFLYARDSEIDNAYAKPLDALPVVDLVARKVVHIGIQGSSPDEIEANKFKWAVNMTARVERLRDFVGLENANLLRIVARAADLVQAQTVAGRKASPEKVQEWLQKQVKWGLLHCPGSKNREEAH